MNVISKKLSVKLKDIGVKQNSQFYYNKVDKYSRLCVKLKNNTYLVIKGPKTSTILSSNESIYSAFTLSEISNESICSAFTLSEINFFLKYYSKYFITYFDIENSCWKLNKNIFKLYFLNINKRKFIDEFVKITEKEYLSEAEIKGELLLFLIKSKFIESDDINNI